MKYEHFDFHAYSKKGSFAALDQLINETYKAKFPFGYFHEAILTEKVGNKKKVRARKTFKQ